MRPIEQIQAINEQLNGAGVWETPKPKPASEHVALQSEWNHDTQALRNARKIDSATRNRHQRSQQKRLLQPIFRRTVWTTENRKP